MSKIIFNQGQIEAIEGIGEFLRKQFDPKKCIVCITGPGGTGKTFIMKYIIEGSSYLESEIKYVAPTHTACRVFSAALGGKKVYTSQSTLGLKLDLSSKNYDHKNPNFSQSSSIKLDGIRLLVIDEASMIGSKHVTIFKRLAMQLGIKIIYMGDDCQLVPINENKSTAFLSCFKNFKLTEGVRQGGDNPINHITTLLRNDIYKSTYSFLQFIGSNINKNFMKDGEGFAVTTSERFNIMVNRGFSDEKYTKNIDMYRVIAYTNDCISNWNNYIRHSIIKDADKAILTKNDLLMSYGTIVDDYLAPIVINSEEYIIYDLIHYIDKNYRLKGFLTKLQLVHGGTITNPIFIIDHTDAQSVKTYYDICKSLVNASKSTNRSYNASKRQELLEFQQKYLLLTNILNGNGEVEFGKNMDYGFSITSHKSQGSTYGTVYVDVNDMVYDKNGFPYDNYNNMLRGLYVACSRPNSRLVLKYG